MKVCILFVVISCYINLVAASATIYYVVPDNNVTCTYRYCHTLSHYANKHVGSNSQLRFQSGVFNLYNDLIIKDVHNVSLIGTSKAANSTANTIIQCNSSVSIVMINITSLTIRNMVIKDCGPNDSNNVGVLFRFRHGRTRRRSLVLHKCKFISFEHLTVENKADNQAILFINIVGYASLIQMKINSIVLACNDTNNFLMEINNVIFTGADEETGYRVILLLSYKFPMRIQILLRDSNFTINDTLNLIGIYHFHKYSMIHQLKIHITHCHFKHNTINSIISSFGKPFISKSLHLQITFAYCNFLHNYLLKEGYLINMLHVAGTSQITLDNCDFYNNRNLKLILFNIDSTHLIPAKVTIKDTSFSFNVLSASLIGNHYNLAQLKFEGRVVIGNTISSSYLLAIGQATTMSFHNYIGFLHNNVKGFVCFTKDGYIRLEENTHMEITNNTFSDYFADSFRATTKRYDIATCFFQYYSKLNRLDKEWYEGKKINYSITFANNNMKPLVDSGTVKLTRCKWNSFTAFQSIQPIELNKRIITFKNEQPCQN